MLRVTIELLPGGRESGRRTIAVGEIRNVSGGSRPNYEAVFREGEGDAGFEMRSSIRRYPRWSSTVWDLVARLAAIALTGGKARLPARPELVHVPVHLTDTGTPYVRFSDIPEPARGEFWRRMAHSTRPLVEEDADPLGCAYLWDWEDFLKGQR